MSQIRKLLFGLALSLLTVSAFAKGININSASATEIAKAMKGVGKAKAKAILAYRKTNGDFKSIDDLTKVKGIGKATVRKNKDRLAIK
ncbi:MAG: helix-hairpin-helix domain-containing protein [Methylococcales bacterium]